MQYLQITMNDTKWMQIIHSFKHILNNSGSILLCVAPLLHNPVKQLSTLHPIYEINCVTTARSTCSHTLIETELPIQNPGGGGGGGDGLLVGKFQLNL